MSQLSTAAVLPIRRRILWIAIVSFGVLFTGMMAIGQYAVRELVAKPRLENYIRTNEIGGKWIEQHLKQTTHTEGTVAWNKILLMCRLGVQEKWKSFAPLLNKGVNSEGQTEQVELDWPKERERLERELDAFLDEMQPLVELVHESSQVAMPVWQPIGLYGGGVDFRFMYDAQTISQLLSLEVYQAMKDSDSERGLAGIRSLKAVVDTCDWELGWTCRSIHFNLRSYLHGAVRKSLSTELWNSNQLGQINLLFNQPVDPVHVWRIVFAAERNQIPLIIEQFTPRTMQDLLTYEEQLEFYKQYDSIVSSGEAMLGKTERPASNPQAGDHPQIIGSVAIQETLANVLPYVASCAITIEEAENQRRLTVSAVAIKRFQLEQQRWPQSLEELAQVGLSIDDWTIPGLGNLGYEETPEGVTVFKFSAWQRRKLLEPLPNSIRRHPDATYDEVLIR